MSNMSIMSNSEPEETINDLIENTKESNEILEDEDIPEIIIRIQNFVATVNLGVTIDLIQLQQKIKIAEYNPTRFHAVIMRIREPKTTALVFRTGKMIVTGAKAKDDSETAAKKFSLILQRAGFPVRFENFTIQNITATCDCGFPISLEGFMYTYSSCSTYEPELFPGLIYRLADPKVVLLIFVSGKVVITGAKNTDMLSIAINNVYPQILEFRKRNVVTTIIRK